MIDRSNDPGHEVGNLEQTLRVTLSDLASAAISPQHRDFISKDSIPEWIDVLANMHKVTMASR